MNCVSKEEYALTGNQNADLRDLLESLRRAASLTQLIVNAADEDMQSGDLAFHDENERKLLDLIRDSNPALIETLAKLSGSYDACRWVRVNHAQLS